MRIYGNKAISLSINHGLTLWGDEPNPNKRYSMGKKTPEEAKEIVNQDPFCVWVDLNANQVTRGEIRI